MPENIEIHVVMVGMEEEMILAVPTSAILIYDFDMNHARGLLVVDGQVYLSTPLEYVVPETVSKPYVRSQAIRGAKWKSAKNYMAIQ